MLSCDFIGSLGLFGTFVHKVDQTWFVFHETWHTILFGIYYCVEVVRNEIHSHMLEITFQVEILWVFKLFWQF